MSAQLLDISPIKASDCRQIVARYLPLKAHAKYSVGLCPFHEERTPSFTVWPSGFYCFGCAAHGDAIDFVQRVESIPFVTAAAKLGAGRIDIGEHRRLAERKRIAALAMALKQRRERDAYQDEDDYVGERRAAEQHEVRYLVDRQAQGWISPGSWADRAPPDRVWLVEGAFAAGNVGLLSGDGGIGKTIILLQLLASAALRRSWLGLRAHPGRSIYYGCEDDHDELWRRLYRIAYAMEEPVDSLGENMLLRSMAGQDGLLMRFKYGEPVVTDRWTELYEQAVDFGASYVVIDTASQTFGGKQGEETQVMAYINLLRKLAIAIQGIVILTKHPSVAGRASGTGESGSVAWHNAVRSRLYFYKKDTHRILTGVKNNYGLPMEPMILRYDRGIFVKDA